VKSQRAISLGLKAIQPGRETIHNLQNLPYTTHSFRQLTGNDYFDSDQTLLPFIRKSRSQIMSILPARRLCGGLILSKRFWSSSRLRNAQRPHPEALLSDRW
jgi:hypothetical protein